MTVFALPRTREAPVLSWGGLLLPKLQMGAGNGYWHVDVGSPWGQSRGTALAQQHQGPWQSCVVPTCRTAVGSLICGCAILPRSHQDCVCPWASHTSEYPESKGEAASCCQPIAVCYERVAQWHSWRQRGREGESCHASQGYSNLHSQSNQLSNCCNTLSQMVASIKDRCKTLKMGNN